ncbi:MAG: DUF503 domain-containing protein [Spirochaetaceae bacterium]|nr:DUF503 domain-containing protein [Spirochaetaceae bacterium]
MVVSMILLIMELPETSSLKDKRTIVMGMKSKLHRKFNISSAEVDLQDSLVFAELGGALVSNSKAFGEKVMNGAAQFIEDNFPVRIQSLQIHSEVFDERGSYDEAETL